MHHGGHTAGNDKQKYQDFVLTRRPLEAGIRGASIPCVAVRRLQCCSGLVFKHASQGAVLWLMHVPYWCQQHYNANDIQMLCK